MNKGTSEGSRMIVEDINNMMMMMMMMNRGSCVFPKRCKEKSGRLCVSTI